MEGRGFEEPKDISRFSYINGKIVLTKESWASLTDEEKTKELQRLIPGLNYTELKKDYEKFIADERLTCLCPIWEHPLLELELIDPVMTFMVMNYMYQQGEKLTQVPLFGYKLNTIHFDVSSLTEYTESEKQILEEAMSIIKNKIYGKES